MNPLPPAYGWLDDLRPLPRMLEEARKLAANKQRGAGDDARIQRLLTTAQHRPDLIDAARAAGSLKPADEAVLAKLR